MRVGERFTVIGCSIIVMLTAGVACQITDAIRSDPVTGGEPLQLKIEPPDQTCESSNECVLVWTDCSTCDCGTPVNQRHEQKYQLAYQELCVDYEGPVCEMYCPPAELVCEQGMCIMLTEEGTD